MDFLDTLLKHSNVKCLRLRVRNRLILNKHQDKKTTLQSRVSFKVALSECTVEGSQLLRTLNLITVVAARAAFVVTGRNYGKSSGS